ncbi:MAG: hypothetical protein HY018_01955 [Hydrogenophilales bacterium]|nr:hypothetical protein [Hydrogenophilales bacterium]
MINHARSTANAYALENSAEPSPNDASPDAYACPICGQSGLIRIRRRFIDRILNLFVRQRRFRCTQPGCQWQGNLRRKRSPAHPGAQN